MLGKILSTRGEIITQGDFAPPSDILNFKGEICIEILNQFDSVGLTRLPDISKFLIK